MYNYQCPDCNDTKLQSDKVARKLNEVIDQVNALIQFYKGVEDKANEIVEDIAEEKVDNALGNVNAKLDNINTTLNEKQNKTDNELNTTSKEITGAINELNSKINQANSSIDETNSSIDEANSRIDEANDNINQANSRIDEINSKINKEKSHSASGYETLPSGLILQWGEAQINMESENSDTTVVTFPKPFPDRAFTVVVSANSNGIINASAYVVQCYDIFQNQFTVRATHSNFTENTGRVSFSWFAIGK